jgi:hypothetical protein
MKKRLQQIPVWIGAVILLVAGAVHGNWTNRWSLSRELEKSQTNLPKLPMVLGDWKGEDAVMDDMRKAQLVQGEIVGHVMRRYVNRRTGDAVSLLVVSGRPGPISTHTPETCYGGEGYELKGPQTPYFMQLGPNEKATFWKGDFAKPNSVTRQGLRIFWSWSPDGKWQASTNPRVQFAPYRALYKVYVVNEGMMSGEPRADQVGPQFLELLMPMLQQTIFGSAKSGA